MSLPREMGRTFSSSSRMRQSEQEPSDRINRSLKRATTSSWDEVRYRAWTSYVGIKPERGVLEIVAYHRHCVQLFQGGHGFQHQYNETSSFYGLDRAREEVWRDSLEVLQYAHPIGISKDLL